MMERLQQLLLEILKTLKDENVKATFFLTGQNIERGGEKAKELNKARI